MPNDKTQTEIDTLTTYCLGRVEQFIRDYAESSGVSANELATRVAGLLHAQTRGPLLGPVDRLSALRQASAGNSVATRAMALARRTYSRAQVSSPSNRKGYSYNGTHWTQQPENKKRLREMRRDRGKNKR